MDFGIRFSARAYQRHAAIPVTLPRIGKSAVDPYPAVQRGEDEFVCVLARRIRLVNLLHADWLRPL